MAFNRAESLCRCVYCVFFHKYEAYANSWRGVLCFRQHFSCLHAIISISQSIERSTLKLGNKHGDRVCIEWSQSLATLEGIVHTKVSIQKSRSLDMLCVCVCVCVCVFIKLHITTQSGPVILVILCHSH